GIRGTACWDDHLHYLRIRSALVPRETRSDTVYAIVGALESHRCPAIDGASRSVSLTSSTFRFCVASGSITPVSARLVAVARETPRIDRCGDALSQSGPRPASRCGECRRWRPLPQPGSFPWNVLLCNSS